MLTSLGLQISLTLGVALAFAAQWATLRSVAARDWSLYWVTRLALGMLLLLLLAPPGHEVVALPQWMPRWMLGVVIPIDVVVGQYFLLRAVRLQLALRQPWHAWVVRVHALFGVFAVMPFLVPRHASTDVADVGLFMVCLRAGAVPAYALAFALLVAFRKQLDRTGARLLMVGLGLMGARNAYSAVFTLLRLGHQDALPADTLLQLASIFALALGALYMVLAAKREEIRSLVEERERARTFETLGRMATGVAHDFNNVLTSIGMSATEAHFTLDALIREEDLSTIDTAVARGTDLVHSLMAYARKDSITIEHVDLRDIILDISGMLRKLMREEHTLELKIAPEPCEILGNPTYITRLLANLVANGRDAMPNGGTLTIETQIRFADPSPRLGDAGTPRGRHVSLKIIDQGTGIPPEVLPHIFEPFYTTKTQGGGSGLGLALTHAFVQQIGGTIRVTSIPDEGTTMEILVPLVVPAATGRRSMQPTTAPGGHNPTRSR
ncbi:MAG: ATP-binding protein [bacterium]